MGKNAAAAKVRKGGASTTAAVEDGAADLMKGSSSDEIQSSSGEMDRLDGQVLAVSSTTTASTSSDGQAGAAMESESQTAQPNLAEGGLQAGATDEVEAIGASFASTLAASFKSTHGLKVTSKVAGFRRAGHAWNTTPTVIALSDLTDEQARQLCGEPELLVELVDFDEVGV